MNIYIPSTEDFSWRLFIIQDVWIISEKERKYFKYWYMLAEGLELVRLRIRLALFWPETLMRSQRLSCAVIKFKPFWESSEYSLVWPEVMIVDESWRKPNVSATLILVWPGLFSGRYLLTKTQQILQKTFDILPTNQNMDTSKKMNCFDDLAMYRLCLQGA